MFVSPIEPEKKHMSRSSLIFICVSLFCGLFSAVYEHYGHGVYSNYMVYLFAFPLVGGTIPYALLGLLPNVVCPSRLSMRIYNSGLAALTVGSCLRGVLDIYGTSSGYVPVYWAAGALLTELGVVIYLFEVHAFRVRRAKG